MHAELQVKTSEKTVSVKGNTKYIGFEVNMQLRFFEEQ